MTVEPVEALRKWFERNSKIISSAKIPETEQCLPHKRETEQKTRNCVYCQKKGYKSS